MQSVLSNKAFNLILFVVTLIILFSVLACSEKTGVIISDDGRFMVVPKGMVSDSKTGLLWKRCAEGYLDFDCSHGKVLNLNWKDTIAYVDKYNKSGGMNGYQDWRVPTFREWASIVSFMHHSPAFDQDIFPVKPCCLVEGKGSTPFPGGPIGVVVTTPTFFWTSTIKPNYCTPAQIKIDNGLYEYGEERVDFHPCYDQQQYHLQLVRGPNLTRQFVNNNDGTVTESHTNRMWKHCSEGLSGQKCTVGKLLSFTWAQAMAYPKQYNQQGGFAGYTDWRVATISELIDLIDFGGQSTNALIMFPKDSTSSWSSNRSASQPEYQAWNAYGLKYFLTDIKSDNKNESDESFKTGLRLVRDIKKSP